jgi:hypothetical protein
MKKIALNLTILLLAHFLSVGQTVLFNTRQTIGPIPGWPAVPIA